MSDPQQCGGLAHGAARQDAPVPQGLLLLVENTAVTRPRLPRVLAAKGFTVTAVNAQAALAAVCNAQFAYALIEVQFRDRKGLDLVRKLRERRPWMRIVVITDHDSFATVILALQAGADDYLPIPASEHDLADALLGRRPALPPVPEAALPWAGPCVPALPRARAAPWSMAVRHPSSWRRTRISPPPCRRSPKGASTTRARSACRCSASSPTAR